MLSKNICVSIFNSDTMLHLSHDTETCTATSSNCTFRESSGLVMEKHHGKEARAKRIA